MMTRIFVLLVINIMLSARWMPAFRRTICLHLALCT